MKVHELTRPQCSRIGQSLGRWVRNFHTWGAAPEQETVKEKMKGNASMKELKFWLHYGPNLETAIGRYPEVLEPCTKPLQDLGKEILAMLENDEGTLVHGDLWSGKCVTLTSPEEKKLIPRQCFAYRRKSTSTGTTAESACHRLGTQSHWDRSI
jgi:hypothetical protein